MPFRPLLYPVLRLVRRTLFYLTPTRVHSYNSKDLANRIILADLHNLETKASFSCKLWQLASSEGQDLHVLDFGGGSGRCGFERLGVDGLIWAVVETPEMAEAANRHFANPCPMFFDSIQQAKAALDRVDVLHVSSALQYSDDPKTTLTALLETDPEWVVFEKTVVTRKTRLRFRQYSFLQDNLAGSNTGGKPMFGAASYWLSAENQDTIFGLLEQAGYKVLEKWEDQSQSHLPLGKGLYQMGLVAQKFLDSNRSTQADD